MAESEMREQNEEAFVCQIERMTMIKLTNLTKEYKKPHKIILNEVSLTIDDNELVAIMGKSGAGKSTLLNILGCIDDASGGEYQYDDTLVSGLTKKETHLFRKQHFSYVFQNFELIPQYTVYENVELPLLARGISNKKEKILKALDAVGILEHKRKKINKLSGGEQQRCAIARAIVAETDVILADEPTGALDEQTSAEIMDLLKELHKKGKTIIIVTHDKDIADQCERCITIKDGKIL